MVSVEVDAELGRTIVEDAKRYVLYSWSVQDQINPIAVAGAEGRHFWDYDGKRYLDFASQLVNVSIGHQHPKIVQAIKDQADVLCTIGPPMANESRSRLGRMLADVTPGDLSVSFFTNGGAEANENAVKLARRPRPPWPWSGSPTPAPSAWSRPTPTTASPPSWRSPAPTRTPG